MHDFQGNKFLETRDKAIAEKKKRIQLGVYRVTRIYLSVDEDILEQIGGEFFVDFFSLSCDRSGYKDFLTFQLQIILARVRYCWLAANNSGGLTPKNCK